LDLVLCDEEELVLEMQHVPEAHQDMLKLNEMVPVH
jgi:hypothetical protein